MFGYTFEQENNIKNTDAVVTIEQGLSLHRRQMQGRLNCL